MARLAEQDARIDGRARFEGREIILEQIACTMQKGLQKSQWAKQWFTPELNSKSELHGLTVHPKTR